MKVHTYDCIVIGTGAAGYNAACRLKEFGVNVAIVTEGITVGTSRNTGSDKQTYYKLETPNKHPLSICCYKNTADGILCSAQDGMKYTFTSKSQNEAQCRAVFDCHLDEDCLFTEEYTVSGAGVDIAFPGADGILVPAFLFDGVKETEISATSGQIVVKYNGSFCKYTFSGEPEEYGIFFNRNGRYRAYKVNADKLHIEIGDNNEL